MNDDFGDRMKRYEFVNRNYLVNRVPVIIRVDGKCFSSFCKRFGKPYDSLFNQCMNNVMEFLCKEIQGAKMGEHHSDEISILATDYDTIRTEAYFNYNIQKMSSVIAGMASSEFCRQLLQNKKSRGILLSSLTWPSFDCRCFNIPHFEVANYFWWRQNDAVRNSISMYAQEKFSHKELLGKSSSEMQEMLFQEYGFNWGNVDQEKKTGFICLKKTVEKEVEVGPDKGKVFERSIWETSSSPRDVAKIRDIVSEFI